MMRAATFAFTAALALSAAGCAQMGMDTGDERASDFVPQATSSNNFEIRSSQIALTKAQSPAVRQFATRMVEDHTQAGQQMKAATAAAGIPAPAQDLLPRHQAMVEELQATTGAQFDQRYVTMQTEAHEEAVELFGDYAADGDVPALKSFAQATLPTLQQHYDHVQRLNVGR